MFINFFHILPVYSYYSVGCCTKGAEASAGQIPEPAIPPFGDSKFTP